MKYSINLNLLSWNLNKSNLDVEHFVLLSFMLQKQSSPSFQREAIYEQQEKRFYFWFSPLMISKELPILIVNVGRRKDKEGKYIELKNEERAKLDKIRRMVQLLEEEGYVEAHRDNQLLNRAFYAFTKKAELILEYNEEQIQELETVMRKTNVSAKKIETSNIKTFTPDLTETTVRVTEPYGNNRKPLTETSVRSANIPYGSFRKYPNIYSIYINYINNIVNNYYGGEKKLKFSPKNESEENIKKIIEIYAQKTNDKLFAEAKGVELRKLNITITEKYVVEQVSSKQVAKEYRAFCNAQKEVAAVKNENENLFSQPKQIEVVQDNELPIVECEETHETLILMCSNIITHNTRVVEKNGKYELVLGSEKSSVMESHLLRLKQKFIHADKEGVIALAQNVSNWYLGQIGEITPDNVETEYDKKQWILANIKTFAAKLNALMTSFGNNQKDYPKKVVITKQDLEKYSNSWNTQPNVEIGTTDNSGAIGKIYL